MEQYLSPIEIITSIVIVFFAILIIFYLKKHSHSYPYKVISSRWVILIIGSIVISQIYITCTLYLEPIHYYQLFHIIFISNSRVVCLIMRCFTLRKMVSYTSSHLKKKFIKNYSFKQRYFERGFKYNKTFIAILIALSLITIVLFGIDEILNELAAMLSERYKIDIDIQDVQLSSEEFIIWFSLNKGLRYILYFSYVYLCITLFKFPLKEDLFKIQCEVIVSFLLEYIMHNTPDIIAFINRLSSQKVRPPLSALFIFESVLNAGLLIFHCILLYLRYNAFKSFSYQDLFTKFNKLINCPITFKLFADYIKSNHDPSSYRLLFFLIDYAPLQKSIKETKANKALLLPRILSNRSSNIAEESFINMDYTVDELNLNQTAKSIFKEYFLISDNDDSYMRNNDIIELPTDIYENLKNTMYNNFSVNNLETEFEKTLSWILNQLYKIYEEYIGKEEEKERIERIMFDIKCFEVFRVEVNSNLIGDDLRVE